MKNILIFIAGCITMLFIAASPQGRAIVLSEPLQPISTVILYDHSDSEYILHIQAKTYLKQGYIIKCVSISSVADGLGYNKNFGYMVLEKY